MSKTKYLKGECQHCGGHIEYPADSIGSIAECPHCHEQTELLLATPPDEPAIPRRVVVWTIISVLVLSLGLVGSLVALRRAQRLAQHQKPSADQALPASENTNVATPDTNRTPRADTHADLFVSAIELVKTPGTSLVYATGTVRNPSNRQRFGVRVELDLFDADGQKLGTAKDYRQSLDAGGEWLFKALVMDPKAVSAKLASIKEEQ